MLSLPALSPQPPPALAGFAVAAMAHSALSCATDDDSPYWRYSIWSWQYIIPDFFIFLITIVDRSARTAVLAEQIHQIFSAVIIQFDMCYDYTV
jgi:hypothetical protein